MQNVFLKPLHLYILFFIFLGGGHVIWGKFPVFLDFLPNYFVSVLPSLFIQF